MTGETCRVCGCTDHSAAGCAPKGISDYLLDMRCPMPKANRAELVWYAMAAQTKEE